MTTIEIDFEVFKELTALRDNEETSYNDVIRRLLHLDISKSQNEITRTDPDGLAYVSKGVRFPHGTKFRKHYKGQEYRAEIIDGEFIYEGKSYSSPSKAARAVTHNSVNGWIFWECQMPGRSDWTVISSLRRHKSDPMW